MARLQTHPNYLDISALQYMSDVLFKKRILSVAVFACTRESTTYIVSSSLVDENSFNSFCERLNISTKTESKKIHTKNTAKIHEACDLLKLDTQELIDHTRQNKAINAFCFVFTHIQK